MSDHDEKACAACGLPYVAKSSRSRFCARSACRRARGRDATRRWRAASVDVVAIRSLPVVGGVEDATRSELELIGQAQTPVGVDALLIARRLDHADTETMTSTAALSRAHLEVVEVAREAARSKGGGAAPVDELRERRRRRGRPV